MRMKNTCLAFGLAVAISSVAQAGTLSAPYAADYTITDYTNITGVPPLYGGITFLNNNTILLGGYANTTSGAIYSVPVMRDASNQITGFGAGTLYSTAPYIDGGLAFGPGGTLFFTEYPTNQLGEITEPCTPTCSPSAQPSLSGLVASSVGTVGIVPQGFSGAGNFIIGSYNGGGWYDAVLTSTGGGTYAVSSATLLEMTGGGPEGIVWVLAGNADFANNSALVAQYGLGTIVAYQLDSNGAPILSTGQNFITGLSGAEGAAIDPLTGDFLFSTFGGGNTIEVVSGFTAPVSGVPEPASLSMLGLGLLALCGWARRVRQ